MAWRVLIRFGETVFRVALDGGDMTIGSRADRDVSIPHPTVSRHHAILHLSDSGVILTDAGSRNGITIAGVRVEMAELKPGDCAMIGGASLTLEEIPESDLEAARL